MSYIGNTATQQAFTPAVDFFNGNGSTTAFTLSRPVASVAQVQVVISNVPQKPGDAYTVSGNTITFTSAPPSGTQNIYVYYTSPITQVIAPGQGTVGTAQLQDNAVITQDIADGAVTPAKLSTGAPTWTSAGNMGLGVTPSASTSNYRTLQIGSSGNSYSIFGQRVAGASETFLGWNAYGGSNTTTNGSGFYYKNTGDASSLYTLDAQHRWWVAASGTAGNAISFTQAMTLNANGALALQGGNTSANGVGIAFPAAQSASTDANTLDDYEEGTWTPVPSSGTFTASNNARYTKIGRLVTITMDGALGGTRSGTVFTISGLPFTNMANGWCSGAMYAEYPVGTYQQIIPAVQAGSTAFEFNGMGTNPTGTQFTNGYLNVTILYFAA